MFMNNKIDNSLKNFIHERSVPFIRENGKMIAQFILTLLFVGLGLWFLKHEHSEISQVKIVLEGALWQWVLAGTGIVVLYIILQGLMYVASFRAVNNRINLGDAVILFLKRNFISVFLPAGGVSSLAFFTGDIEKKGITKSQIHFASSIYGFIGILSVIIVAIPAFIYALTKGTVGSSEWLALLSIILLLSSLWTIYRSIIKKGKIYEWLIRIFPASEVFMDDLQSNKIEHKHFIITILYSVIIEFTGIAHLYISMIALGFQPSLFAAVMGYIISVIFLIVSPFLRGLGAIEVSMSYVLMHFGFGSAEAIATTLLYRFFEFWMPLVAGIVSFVLKVNKLLMRVIPAILLFTLGIINIISVLTPAIADRLNHLKQFLMIDAIQASNYFVLMAGLFLLVTAAFMLKGLRTAWWFALFLSVISFIGHITKAIDYEEASLALLVLIILITTRKEYYVKNNPRLRFVGIQTAVLTIIAILIYGTVGFYFLNKRHFLIDFNLWQSVRYTIQNYFLVGSADLVPHSHFARNFLYSINISGFLSLAFLVYTFISPYVIKNNSSPEELTRAKELLQRYGKSSLDYFKTYSDKMIFLPNNLDAFVSYRVSGNYAVVLENPVTSNDIELEQCIKIFDGYCYECGMKSLYYRVPEESLPAYKSLGLKSLFLGQEGIVDLNRFSLEGGARKSMRNALNKVTERGYKAHVHQAPIKDGLLQKIKSVSDEWLAETDRSEIIFSQGMFVWEELKQQTIITVENAEEKIVAFLNVIPDYAPNEGTYDLIRKTADAPNGIMDFILIELFKHLKEKGIQYVNLGFAPLSGLDSAESFPEKSMKFAYERIRSFSHYKGLRDFKDKFEPVWQNKYLIYDHDYDLLQVPSVLSNVIKI